MTHDTAFPFLTVLVLLPAGAALVTALVPRGIDEQTHRLVVLVVGLGATLATLALAVTVAVRYQAGDGGFQMVSDHVWAPQLGISWHLGVDGISLFLVLMSAVLFPIVMLVGGWSGNRGATAWLLLLEAGCLGSFVALDLVLFFLFFELTLVPVYFLINGWGFANRAYAAIKFFLYTFLGSAFLLVGIVAVAFIHERQTGKLTFDLVALTGTHLGTASQILLFLAFTAAFAVKAPVFPFHTWSPDAYAEAPTGGVGGAGRGHGQDGDLRHHPLRPDPVPPGGGGPGAAAAHSGGRRHPLRRRRGLRHPGLEASGRLLVTGPYRFRRAGHVRPHHPGGDGRGRADGQPRAHHRLALHPDRLDLRAPGYLEHRRICAACSVLPQCWPPSSPWP